MEFCGFRLIPPGKADEIRSRLAKRNFRFDTWDVFLADRASALAASEAIMSRGLPNGLTDLDRPSDPVGEYTFRIQALMAAADVVPFSGSLLTGALGPATTVAVGDGNGTIAAAAHGYLPHNTYSPYHRHAWGGLVAVAESQRGKGLGNYINATMIVSVFRDLDATHVYELVSVSNIPSRRMVESSGLRLEPALVCDSRCRTKARASPDRSDRRAIRHRLWKGFGNHAPLLFLKTVLLWSYIVSIAEGHRLSQRGLWAWTDKMHPRGSRTSHRGSA